VPECPVDAIYADTDLPDDQKVFKEINAEVFKLWPRITKQKPPMPNHEEWNGKPNKRDLLER
jgi:ferredoxin